MRLTPVLIAAIAALVAACGSSKDATYADPAAPFTFSYPKELSQDLAAAKREVPGRPPTFTTNVGVNGSNLVVVSTYAIRRAYEDYQPAEFQSLVDTLVRTIARAGPAQVVKIGHGKLGSLPAYVYDLEGPGDDRSRYVLAFQGKTEYFVRCAWAPAQAETITAACDQVTSTFEIK